MFYNDQRVALRRVVADFARNQVKAEYNMNKAIPKEYVTMRPIYPSFASSHQGSSRQGAATHTTPTKKRVHKPPPQHRHLVGNWMKGDNSIVVNSVWNSSISAFPETRTSTGEIPLRIVLYSRGNDGTRSLKYESRLMKAIGEKFEAYTAICCDFDKATMPQQISYSYHADIVSSRTESIKNCR